MKDMTVLELPLPDNILQPLLNSANSSILDEAFVILIKHARTEQGCLELASKNTVLVVLELIKHIAIHSKFDYLLSSLKLLRNLCAGECHNQTSFIVNNGVETISSALDRVDFASDSDIGIVRTALQVLGNVALAGEEHQQAIWVWFFPDLFLDIAKIRSSEICDPLCMVIYTCCGSIERLAELSGSKGLETVGDIIKTASTAGFGEVWLEWLLSKVCFDDHHFPTLFHLLYPSGVVVATGEKINSGVLFSKEQAFLLSVLSENLNRNQDAFTVSKELAMSVFGILKKAYGTVDFSSRGILGLPTGLPSVDVLGYSLVILRDICAQNGPLISRRDDSVNIVDTLLSSGLLELLLNILRELEPPEMIRKCTLPAENEDSGFSEFMKKCPYRGFRRDIVAVIANCLYRRKHAQDEIRQRNGILLLLQQCVTEDDNPFLREWGLYLGRNLVEGNKENEQEITELRLQGTVDIPELTRLGLQVVVNEATGRPKIINIS